jgi:enediyne biosynthesis protein E4
MFHNQGKGKFVDTSKILGTDFAHPIVARGAAYADYDHDGDLDIVINTNKGPAVLYTNESGNRNHWLSVRLTGTKSNRSALGAVVRVESTLGKQWKMVHSGSSYCSQSDLALAFGLGQDTSISLLSIEWPSGVRQDFKNITSNQYLSIDESKGILK